MRAPDDDGDEPENRRELRRAQAPHDSQILIELPSGEERLEPLLDLSPTGVAVLLRATRSALQPGTVLRRLRFFTDGECTLQTRATIRDVQPVTLADGRPGLKLGLQLEGEAAAIRTELPTQEYTQPAVVMDALQNLVAAAAVVKLDSAPTAATAIFARADGKGRLLVLKIDGNGTLSLKRGQDVDLVTELYGTRMSVVAKYRERRGDELRFTWPSVVRVFKYRAGGRLRKLPKNLEISFESPFVRGLIRRPIIDLSPRGAAFVSEPEDGLLVGMLLRTAEIELDRGTLKGQAIVRNVRRHGGGFITGIELADVSDNGLRMLGEYVDAHFHPEVRSARPEDLRHLWSLYDEMDLFLRPHAALSPVAAGIDATRQALLGRGRSIHVQMVATTGERLLASAELVRLYGSTWSLVHAGARRDAGLSSDTVVVPLIQSAWRRTDFAHLHTILDPNKSRDGLARLLSLEPTPSTLALKKAVLMSATTVAPPTKDGAADIQEAAVSDLEWVAARLAERLSPLAVSAYCLKAGELRLEETGRFFHAVGLWRRRRVRLAMSVGGPMGFALVEQSSPGVSLAGTADLVRLFPMRATGPARQAALLSLAHDALRLQKDADIRTCMFLVSDEEAEILAGAGYNVVGERLEILATREGAQRVVNCLNLLS
ncbi:MAG: hypothetical protein HY903_10370 [Deltaproteobacteria bacterium]|nr:hypothetical protein [Deltaproteobacteria bacterium]